MKHLAYRARNGTTVKRLPSLAAGLALASLLLVGCAGGEEAQNESSEENDGGNVASAAQPSEGSSGNVWPVEEVAAEVSPSVVQVNVEGVQRTPRGPQEGRGVGSGVTYREDGYVITNSHVVQNATQVNVAFADGSVEEGEVVGTDPYTEIAVIRVDRDDLPAAEFGDGGDLVLGEPAVAVGSPSGFQSTVTAGVVSGLNREVPAEITGGRQESALVDLIQTDAAISPGSSGGALADANGEVIGINVAYLPPAQTGAVNIGFAIPSETATSVADQIIESGEAEHPYLGVSLTGLTTETANRFGVAVESGALVTNVDPQGPAAQANIESRSVITAIGDEEVETSGDLLSALREYSPGDTVGMTVASGGETRTVTVELGDRG
ncbi:MAG: trypsin-like peptidase domain-containing protein [Actinomycetota bacterium]|nr:trypsin-like peptidase domain-containing protein [Actinomycetota bacterium]